MSRFSVPAPVAVIAAALTVTLGACSAAPDDGGVPPGPPPAALEVRILDTRPHDTSAFTQGLEIHDGRILEGTGRSGQSRVTATDFTTGRELDRADLEAPLFGEGITVAGDVLWQITWKDGIAVARDPETLAERRRATYDGEGWGLCALEPAEPLLAMSDGSATVTFRDATSFDEVRTIEVTRNGRPQTELNELECTPDGIYANVWRTDEIVRFDPSTGVVDAVVDASALRDELAGQADSGTPNPDVLNGIAALDGTDLFLVTGKLWPSMFVVEFVPAQ